jgi:hypothetical protein
MKTKNLIYLVIAGIVIYVVWKKFIKKTETKPIVDVEPVVIVEESKTQGDMVNELMFARGN